MNRRRWLVGPLHQVKLQNLRTVGIPYFYKLYRIWPDAIALRVLPGTGLLARRRATHFDSTPTCDLAKGYIRRRTRLRLKYCNDTGPRPRRIKRRATQFVLAVASVPTARRLELDGEFCFHFYRFSIHDGPLVLTLGHRRAGGEVLLHAPRRVGTFGAVLTSSLNPEDVASACLHCARDLAERRFRRETR